MTKTDNARLTRAWAILAGLTVISVATALYAPEHSLIAVGIALAASFIKARQVLDHFLDLRRAGAGWRGFFSAALLLILGVTMVCHVYAHLH